MQNTLQGSALPAHNLEKLAHSGYAVGWSYHGPATGDDLTSAGLGLEGLASPSPPSCLNPEEPTTGELRRLAIYQNYRALTDTTTSGGFGRYYGPKKLVPGLEVRGVLEDNALAIVQIPEHFRPEQSKVLLVPASSSRGVYGGILISEWGLSRGYVVVLCDKGCGTGFHNLTNNLAVSLDGHLVEASSDGERISFIAPDPVSRIEAFRTRHPHRYATKHAHSGLNVEEKWGQYVLQSLEFSHKVLEVMWPDSYSIEGTRVIATGLSNGGGASLRAAEQDEQGAIDGIVVGEPNVTPIFHPGFTIQQGDEAPLVSHSKSLLEYTTLQNVFQSASNFASVGCRPSLRRVKALQQRGFAQEHSSEEASRLALRRVYEAGLLKAQAVLAESHASLGVYEGMAVALVNCLGRFMVTDHLFGYSYGAVDLEMRVPSALGEKTQTRLYALANGLVPTAGVELINDLSLGGPVQSLHSISPSSALADGNLDGAVKLFEAAWGQNPVTGETVAGQLAEVHRRVAEGMESTKATADLGGRPCLIVNGRCDSIIAPNHASRSYLGRNLLVEKEKSRLSYIELEHAQHLDALNALPAYAEQFVPLLPYLFEALEVMEATLESGEELPPSQLIRTRPRLSREGQVEELDDGHIPSILKNPGASERIVLDDAVLRVP